MAQQIPSSAGSGSDRTMEQHVRVGVECPACHWKHFVEAEIDVRLLKSPVYSEIKGHLEAWLSSHCPDHLSAIANMSRN